jgi:hypothetical protein
VGRHGFGGAQVFAQTMDVCAIFAVVEGPPQPLSEQDVADIIKMLQGRADYRWKLYELLKTPSKMPSPSDFPVLIETPSNDLAVARNNLLVALKVVLGKILPSDIHRVSCCSWDGSMAS